MRRPTLLICALVLFGVIAGCGSNLAVATIQLGRSVNADKTVANHTTRFAPTDTVYVSVITEGVGSGTLKVKWQYAGRVVGEPTKEVKNAGATEFHLENAGGFPPGDYTVEVFLNDVSAGTKEFRVESQPAAK